MSKVEQFVNQKFNGELTDSERQEVSAYWQRIADSQCADADAMLAMMQWPSQHPPWYELPDDTMTRRVDYARRAWAQEYTLWARMTPEALTTHVMDVWGVTIETSEAQQLQEAACAVDLDRLQALRVQYSLALGEGGH